MIDLYEIANMAAKALIREMGKQGMLQLEQTAFDRTKVDVQNFKKALELLSNDQVPQDFKKKIAMHSINMQRALKRLNEIVKDQDFILFYQLNFNGQTYRSLAAQYEVDERTVRTAVNRCISNLSIFLHPDVFIDEILN